ncbi:hypothetical protein GCM10023261_08700 [Bartonella jaculi]|uniref:Uncharacterized protein n=1 Tax=Bartonella jaculi TaxID=686226 RepID=A0ABP9N4F6_9HYPH
MGGFQKTSVKRSECCSDVYSDHFNIFEYKNAYLIDLLYCAFRVVLFNGIGNEIYLRHEIFKFTQGTPHVVIMGDDINCVVVMFFNPSRAFFSVPFGVGRFMSDVNATGKELRGDMRAVL